MSRRRTPYVVNASGRQHRCTICGRLGPWSDAWRWWGSYKQLDDGNAVVKVCSDGCAAGLNAADLNRIGRRLREDPDYVHRDAA